MIKRSGIWLLVSLLLTGAAVWGISRAVVQWAGPGPVASSMIHRREDNPANKAAIDSAISMLRSGDLVLRTGADAISFMLLQMNLTDKTYSHCGIVMIENGYPFVYHSIGGEDNPNERLRRDSAVVFFSPVSNERLGIARLDMAPMQLERLHTIVHRYYTAGARFDLDFDLGTDDKLYCAEFVYKSIQEAVADTGYFGKSQLLDRCYVGVDNLTNRRHARIICDVRYKP